MAILPPDPVYMMRGDMGPVHKLFFRISPYIEHLYVGAESGLVHIWDLRVLMRPFDTVDCHNCHVTKDQDDCIFPSLSCVEKSRTD